MAELKNPRDFPKSLCLLQVLDLVIYIITAVVTYVYAGDGVAAPALGSTNPILQKVAYGIALPTIVIAGVIFGHVAAKYIYLRVFQGTDRMHKKDFVATGSWVLIGVILWVIAWIIAESVPVFDTLLSLISSLFGSWFSCEYSVHEISVCMLTMIVGLSGFFWLYMNWGRYTASWKKMVLTVVNLGCIALACAIVRPLFILLFRKKLTAILNSVVWDCTLLASQSTTTRPAPASRARITHDVHVYPILYFM